MTMQDDAMALIGKGNMYEDAGDDQQAEAFYLRAIAAMDPDDKGAMGPVYINLGTNAQYAGRYDDAKSYFRKAIDVLSGRKGDDLLQCAHAHYNLAKMLLTLDDGDAVPVAAEARRLYEAYPFASPTDRADAAVLTVVVDAVLTQQVTETAFHETWKLIKVADADSLDKTTFIDFMVNFVRLTAVSNKEKAQRLADEFAEWASPEIVDILSQQVNRQNELDGLMPNA